MMTRRPKISLYALTLALLIPLSAHAAVFHPDTFTLANGLQVIVVQNPLAPAVNQMVWYKVGSSYETKGKTGLAHYLEHLMFRGTPHVPAGAFSKIIAAQGGNDNAFTAYDYTAYFETVAADRLPLIMQMEADRMQNLHIEPKTATPELSVVLNERQERTDNNPEARFEEKVRHTLWGDHPYGTPVIGWKPEIEKLSVTDARDFYEHHYAPNNAVVIISGAVKTADVMRLAAGTYGRIPAHELAPTPPFPAVHSPKETRLEQSDAGIAQPQMEWHFIVPSYKTQQKREAYAYEVLSEVLDSGEVGILYHDLVVKQQQASGIETDYDPDARGDTMFTIGLTPRPGQDIHAVEKALRDEIATLGKTGVPPRKIAEAKQRLMRSALFARDSLMMPGYAFGMALTTGHKVKDVEAWPDRIKTVTPNDVNAALRNLANDPHNVMGILLPDPNATPEERARAMPQEHGVGIR